MPLPNMYFKTRKVTVTIGREAIPKRPKRYKPRRCRGGTGASPLSHLDGGFRRCFFSGCRSSLWIPTKSYEWIEVMVGNGRYVE